MEEVWRDVPGFEGKYQVSISTKEGMCRSLNYNRTGRTEVLKNTPNRDGYIKWNIKGKYWQAARWIALTYPELVQNEWFEGAEIDHIDTDPLNNHPSNLRWVTRKGNLNNPLTREHNSKSRKGKILSELTKEKLSDAHKGVLLNREDQSKWVIKLSLDNEILHFYQSISQAHRESGVDLSSISRCCLGKQSKAGNYIWKYAD